jgi:hypothetical protein
MASEQFLFLLEEYTMKQTGLYKMVGFVMGVVLVLPFAAMSAAPATPAEKGITGDWLLKIDFDGRQMNSIVCFSKDKEGKLAGQWIGFFGLGELQDVKYEGNNLSFLQISRFGDQEFRMNLAGKLDGDKISGTLSSDRGESKVEGQRVKPMPAAVGSWEMKVKMGEREFTATLVVKADKEGKLTADWQSQFGEHQITDVQFKEGKLTFKRTSKIQDRQFESTFEGTVKADTLSGTFKSERGESAAEGKRIGAALIGKWELEITSERGTYRQILQVNPDLSGLYGPMSVKKINLEGDQVTFQIVLEFGDQKFEISFAGKLDGQKLTGEFTSERGTQKATGKKLIPAPKKG